MNYDIKKLHSVLIEILDYAVSVCEEHNLQYCLVYGTALGAYRHKGFIPWDDDVDIAMPRDDYEKFLEIIEAEHTSKYSIQTEKTEENYFLTFAKIRKNGTVFIESILEKPYANNGVYIDVFPLDFVENSKKTSYKIKRKSINYFKHILKLQACPGLYKQKQGKIKFYFDCILSFPGWILSNKTILKILRKLMISKKNLDETAYVAQYDESLDAAVMEKEIYFPLKKCQFEGKSYYVSGNIEEYLERQYGSDFMKLPPIEKRATHSPIELKI